MKRMSVVAIAASLVFTLAFWTPGVVRAQTPSQSGNSISVRGGSQTGGGNQSGMSLGLTIGLHPGLDATFGYESIPSFAYTPMGLFSNEFDLGIRYHFPVLSAVGISPYIGGGGTITSAIGGTSVTGIYVQGGLAVRLAPTLGGYAGLTYGSASGVATTSYDAGLQFDLTSRLTGLVGFAGSSGTNNIYLGLNVKL